MFAPYFSNPSFSNSSPSLSLAAVDFYFSSSTAVRGNFGLALNLSAG